MRWLARKKITDPQQQQQQPPQLVRVHKNIDAMYY
jgi:hypothetical protein